MERENVIDAIKSFDEHGAPDGYGQPTRYWLVHPRTRELYPQKTIYGMANNLDQANCPNATVTRRKLEGLDFEIFDEQEAGTAAANIDFQDQVRVAAEDDPQARANRLDLASPAPDRFLAQVVVYRRNPDVVAERLSRANGVCDGCEKPAPFMRARDNTPYLEVHHLKPLAEGGEDTVENTQALCPNCHRKAHFG